MEGGLRSLTQLLRSLEQGLPAIILQDSGGASDLLADALARATFLQYYDAIGIMRFLWIRFGGFFLVGLFESIRHLLPT